MFTKTVKTLLLLTTLVLTTTSKAYAQSSSQTEYKGRINSITENGTLTQITSGQLAGEEIQTQNGNTKDINGVEYKVGDRVFVLEAFNADGTPSYFITGYDRIPALFWLFILFAAVVIWVSKKWGITSLIGMAYSFFIIFNVLLPLLLKGYNPLAMAIFGAFMISPVTFFLSHGLNRKTAVALASTLISLLVTGVLAVVFIRLARLTGFGSEEAFFLQISHGEINIQGLYLAGIIIGALGILDDITISQAAIVSQLKNSIRGIGDWELYKKAMEIGHDHIASAVNTLVLVYTGAALPLLLLFTNSSQTFGQALNSDIIADEIVRTLVGSIGLVLAVPVTTWLAVLFIRPDIKERSKGHFHHHSH